MQRVKYEEKAHEEKNQGEHCIHKNKKIKAWTHPRQPFISCKKTKKTEEKNREKAIDMKTAHTPNY